MIASPQQRREYADFARQLEADLAHDTRDMNCELGVTTALIVTAIVAASSTAYTVHAQNQAAERAAQLDTQAAQQQREALSNESQVNQNQFNLTFGENKRQWDLTQRRNFEMWREREQQLAPYRASGLAAQNAINGAIGLAPAAYPAPPTWDQFNANVGMSGDGTPLPPPPSGPGGGSRTNGPMPQGIDPRIAALYQRYGVTPGARGSGPADWQYWQNDALHNANGDWGYVLGRLENDLKGGGPNASSTGPRVIDNGPGGGPSTSLSSFAAQPGDARVGPGNTSLAALMQPGTGAAAVAPGAGSRYLSRVPGAQAPQFDPYSLYARFYGAGGPTPTPTLGSIAYA